MPEYTLILGNKNYSSWSLRVWIWMRHLGLEFQEVPVALYTSEMEEQLAPYFSNNKVPVLLHDGEEFWDSLAILEYLVSLYPQQGFPKDQKARAIARSLCNEMHSSFIALRSELPMNCRRVPSPLEVSEACIADIDRIQALWKHARQYREGKDYWLFGDFGIVDAMFAPVAIRLDRYQIPLDEAAASYTQRLLNHPAMIEWIAASRAETAVIAEEER